MCGRTPWVTAGEHEVGLGGAVASGGEGFAQVQVDVDNSCKTLEQVVDGCGTIAADLQCKLDSELVDGVQTWINGVATGLKPLPQTRILGGPACPADLTRDFFLKDRRSEERRVGKECVSKCRSGWSPQHKKKKNKEQ